MMFVLYLMWMMLKWKGELRGFKRVFDKTNFVGERLKKDVCLNLLFVFLVCYQRLSIGDVWVGV